MSSFRSGHRKGDSTPFWVGRGTPASVNALSEAFDDILAMRGGSSRVVVSQYSPEPQLQGLTLEQVAQLKGMGCFDAAVELLRGSEGHVSMVYHVLEEADIEAIFKEPFVMVASDGSAVAPTGVLAGDYYPHPRNYGCFPRVLGEYVRERQLVDSDRGDPKDDLAAGGAVRTRAARAAAPRLARGHHRVRPRTVADRATFDTPRAYPDGITHVFVNGQHVIDSGEHTGARPGAVLFSPARVAPGAV